MVSAGWPSKHADVLPLAKPYFSYRDEGMLLDGVLFKGSRLIVPAKVRPDILKKLHISHQGTAATVRRARTAVFWPQMSADIKLQTEKCVTCALDAPAQPHESLQSHDIPEEVWSKIGMDIFTFKNKDYLLLVDYFSDFFKCEQLSDLQSRSVIKACKKTFSRHGLPRQVHSDNGSQFTSDEFVRFAKEWGFYHATSSPGHQQSNGKAEAFVKIIKWLMKKADNSYLALLKYRNTPTAGMTMSPAERMFGHATRSTLPTSRALGANNTYQEKARKKVNVQRSYNKSAVDLHQLAVGSPVLLRDVQAYKTRWLQGRVFAQVSDRSYMVSNNSK